MAQKFISLHNVIDGILDSDGINLGQLKQFTEGSEFYQSPVISQLDLTTAEPPTPTIGDRYINLVAGVSSVTAQPVLAGSIYEWNGTLWEETAITSPSEGTISYDINLDEYVLFDGSNWVPFTPADPQYVTDYFISDDIGDDTNTGLAEKTAFKTLGAALDAAKIAAAPCAFHILDDATYIVTEDAATPGIRNLGIAFTIDFPHATLTGQAGGVDWKIGVCHFNGHSADGTNLTLKPTSSGIKTFRMNQILNPSFFWVKDTGAGSAGVVNANVKFITGTPGIADYTASKIGLISIVTQLVNTSGSSASTLNDFTSNGSGNVIWFNSLNYDPRNNGTGDFVIADIKSSSRIYMQVDCIGTAVSSVVDIDASSLAFVRASDATDGAPMPYSGNVENIYDYSLAEGQNFSKLDATAGLDLADLINVRDVSTGEQVKATLTQLQAFIGGGGGFLKSTVTPPVISSDQNNYNPTGLASGAWLRLTSNAAIDINGINSTGFNDRDIVTITNVGLSDDIKLMKNSGLAIAGNRFLTPDDITLKCEGHSVVLAFDSSSSGWRVLQYK